MTFAWSRHGLATLSLCAFETRIRTWRNAFFMSAARITGCNLLRVRTYHNLFWRAGPVSRQLFNRIINSAGKFVMGMGAGLTCKYYVNFTLWLCLLQFFTNIPSSGLVWPKTHQQNCIWEIYQLNRVHAYVFNAIKHVFNAFNPFYKRRLFFELGKSKANLASQGLYFRTALQHSGSLWSREPLKIRGNSNCCLFAT